MAAPVGLEDIVEVPVAPVLVAAIKDRLWVEECTVPLWAAECTVALPWAVECGTVPPRRRGCCGCLFPVIGVLALLIGAMILLF